ncbi:MAG: F0F1 ATP synthase subunit A [Bacteroidales bacterium]|nr:F0F1 ATP synthase subunit A [Bacteroidales bacterium]
MVHPFMFLEWFADLISLHVGPHVLYTWLAMAILLSGAWLASRTISMVPGRMQNFMEAVMTGFDSLIENVMGKDGKPYFPLIATIGMFVLVGNLLGLVPSCFPPTASLNTNAALALTVFFMTHYIGIKKHGFHYIKHFMGPIVWLAPLMIIIEILSHLVRPISLSLRLFGNMYGKEIVLMIFFALVPLFLPIPIMFLGVLISMIQAFVFVLLSMIYIAGSLEEAH